MIQAYRDSQINLQHGFYIKGLNTNYRVQTRSGSLKQSSKYNKILRTTIKVSLTSCPRCAANWPEFHGEDGPTRRSTQKEAVVQSRMHRPPRSQRGHNLLRRVTTTTMSILIPSKAYPTMGILSPISRHAKLFGSGVGFAEKLLVVNPYFQYFSSSLVFEYQLDLL